MGKKDAAIVTYLKDNNVFADLCNFWFYDGKEIIQPEDLKEKDIREVYIPDKNPPNAKDSLERYGDVVRAVEHHGVVYAAIVIEAQAKVDYGMVVRTMLLNALSYHRELQEIKKENLKNTSFMTGEELLSGIREEQKLTPIIPLVLFLSPEVWNAPICIHDILKETDSLLLEWIPDYRINVIAPSDIDNEKLNQLRTSLRTVLKTIKVSGNKDDLKNFIEKELSDIVLDREAATVINTYTGATIKIDTQEDMNMKDAFDELYADWKEEGRVLGVAEGKAIGVAEGKNSAFNTLVGNLMHAGTSKEDATVQAKQLLSIK